LLADIDRYIGLDNATIIFTSDHGEEFGEHGGTSHGHSLHHEVLNVPLIIAAPDLPPGKVVNSIVRTVDVFPTILDITGLASSIPSTIMGASLRPLFTSEAGDRFVYAEGVLFGNSKHSVIENKMKLITEATPTELVKHLYAIDKDLLEKTDLAQTDTQSVTALAQSIQQTRDRLTPSAQQASSAQPAGTPLSHKEQDEKKKRHLEGLRSLGYVR
jgi:arylsulfatase A-like enzyme